jgi:uncharacterized protein with HEPN domain
MSPRDPANLLDILEAAKLVLSFIEGMDLAAFEKDIKTQSAVMRQMEIMGEATKRLSEEFRQSHEEAPWRRIAGMRDILIHCYDDVIVDTVWRIAKEDVPALIPMLEKFLI